MDRGVCFAGFWLKFAQFFKPEVNFFPAAAEKKSLPPDWGMRADDFVATIQARLGRQPIAPYFDTQADCVKFLVVVATGGFEVLVNHALNSIE